MAKGEQRSNKEVRKPKKDKKIKVTASDSAATSGKSLLGSIKDGKGKK